MILNLFRYQRDKEYAIYGMICFLNIFFLVWLGFELKESGFGNGTTVK